MSDTEDETVPAGGVRVLILTFEFQDLDLGQETKDVEMAFERLHYNVESYSIPMSRSQKSLQRKMAEFLKRGNSDTLMIVYYHGHGGLSYEQDWLGFKLSSHNYPRGDSSKSHEEVIRTLWDGLRIENEETRNILSEKYRNYQRIASVRWEDIQDDIIDADCNTLIILDCCGAGLAAVPDLNDASESKSLWQRQHRRQLERESVEEFHETRDELIASSTWGENPFEGMSVAMVEALQMNLGHEGDRMSPTTLIRDINRILAVGYVDDYVNGSERAIPQAVHYLLRRTKKPTMYLKYRTDQIDLEAGIGISGSHRKK